MSKYLLKWQMGIAILKSTDGSPIQKKVFMKVWWWAKLSQLPKFHTEMFEVFEMMPIIFLKSRSS